MSEGQTLAIFIAAIGGAYVVGDWLGRTFVRGCEKLIADRNPK